MPVVNTTNYFYEDVITLACDESFWVFTDKGRSTVDFVCFKTGYFEPNPRDISCTGKRDFEYCIDSKSKDGMGFLIYGKFCLKILLSVIRKRSVLPVNARG